ncbi:MAG: type II toxin-antitoxin system RelE/ParE family toxin [Planctomycetes bacterium]|nr:type II toxin-antitoxin system RelE/ParE family toxin [Planctomycetota bacterium]
MSFTFHPKAHQEFEEAIDYYGGRKDWFAFDFYTEVQDAIALTVEFPQAWPQVEEDTRRCPVKRFPYALIYTIEPTCIFILAVAHSSRDPGYWKDRK